MLNIQKQNTGMISNITQRCVMLLMSVIMLASCEKSHPDPECVSPSNFGITYTKTISLDPAITTWTDTGVNVQNGKTLNITVDGDVYLCMNNATADPGQANTWIPPLVASNPAWWDSGAVIKRGYKYKMAVSGSGWNDGTTAFNSGKGLFGYFGPTASPSGTPPSPSGANIGFSTAIQDDNDGIFEMYRRDIAASSIMPSNVGYGLKNTFGDKELWFRYQDVDTVNANSGTPYTVTSNGYSLCYGSNGKYLLAEVGPDPSTISGGGTIINSFACPTPNPDPVNQPYDANAPYCNDGIYNQPQYPGTAGRLWLRIANSGDNGSLPPSTPTIYPPDLSKPGNQVGSYSVTITIPNDIPNNPIIQTIITDIIGPVRDLLVSTPTHMGITERMYRAITEDVRFVSLVRAILILSILLFAYSFVIGTIVVTQKEAIVYTLKLSIIAALISPGSWEFFNTYLFSFFLNGTSSLIWIMSNNINSLIANSGDIAMNPPGDTGEAQSMAVFGFLNTTMAILFSQETWIKIQALLVMFPLGIFYVGVMMVGIYYYLFAVLRAFLMYLTSIIMTAILLFMAPVFICFMLFQKTYSIFRKWVAQLAVYALQPVLLFILLAVFNVFIVMSLTSMLDFSACYTCVWYIDLPISELMSIIPGVKLPDFDKFCAMPGYLPWGYDSTQSVYTQAAKTPISLFLILIFVILANAIYKFIDWIDFAVTQLVGDEGVGLSTPGLASSRAINQARGIAGSTKNMVIGSAMLAGRTADKLSGYRLSDGAKRVTRSAITHMPLPSALTNAMVGRGRDRALGGEKLDYGKSFMTRAERKGYDKKASEFAKLDGAQKREAIDANVRNKLELDKRKDELSKMRLEAQQENYGSKTGRLVHTLNNLTGSYKNVDSIERKENRAELERMGRMSEVEYNRSRLDVGDKAYDANKNPGVSRESFEKASAALTGNTSKKTSTVDVVDNYMATGYAPSSQDVRDRKAKEDGYVYKEPTLKEKLPSWLGGKDKSEERQAQEEYKKFWKGDGANFTSDKIKKNDQDE